MHRGSFVWTTTPSISGRRTPRSGPARVCVCVLSWQGWAGRTPGRVFVRLTLSCGRSWCSLCLLGPLRAGVALLLVVPAFFLPLCAPLVSNVSCFRALGALGLGVKSPPLSCSLFPFFSPSPSRVYFSCVFSFPSYSLFFFPVPWCAGCAALRLCVLGCGACWCVLLWALCFGGGRCALALCRSVPPACASSFCVVACCVARAQCGRAGGVALPLCCLCCLPVLPPPPPLVVVSSVVLCRASCRVAPRSVVYLVLCPVACRVLASGWVLAPCCSARCCAWSCCAVFVVLCCPALLRSLLVFFSLVPSLSVVLRAVSVLCLCGAVLVCLRRCSLCGAPLPLRRWLVFCVVACCVFVFAVGPGCPLLSPGGSWWPLVSCFGGVRRTARPSQEWQGTEGSAHTNTHPPQHPRQELRGAA